jgi:hypothetical protein
MNADTPSRLAQLTKIILTACREVRTDLHGIVKVLFPLLLSNGKSNSITREMNDVAAKILTGRAAFDAHTDDADDDAKAAALGRSVTTLMVVVVSIAMVAYKSLCIGKRRLTNVRELTFASTHLSNCVELFDPHLATGMSEATTKTRWESTKQQVQEALLPNQTDFGLTPRAVHSIKALTGELVVYVWYILLHESTVWGKKQRIDSTGTTGERNFCAQVCLQNAFLDVIKNHPVGCWFDIDPAPVQVRQGAIAIHTPNAQSLECARNYMRGVKILPGECSITNLNQLQSLRGDVLIFTKNSTDMLPATEGPWSDEFDAELHADGSERASAEEPHARDSDVAGSDMEDDDDGARSDLRKRSAHAAGLSDGGSDGSA